MFAGDPLAARPLIVPPRLRGIEPDRNRRATWLELFFDLVFVVAIAIGLNLDHDPTVGGFLQYLALFVPVWWAWAGFTYYANRFDSDDVVYRLTVLLGMFAVAALAVATNGAIDEGGAQFAASYLAVRLIIIALYVRVIRHVEVARPLAKLFTSRFSLAVVFWVASLFVEPPWRWWLWAIALALELTTPLFARRLMSATPLHPGHIPERFGLLTIIVLGESVVAVVLGVHDVSWELGSALAAAGGFVAAAALWWLYFESLDSSMVARGVAAGLTFTYAHFPLVAGLAAVGVGVKLAILSAGGDKHFDGTGWIMLAGLALAMLGMAVIQLATPPTLFDIEVWLRLGTAAAALILIPFSLELPTAVVAWIVAALVVGQLVYELALTGERRPVSQ